MGGLFSLTGIFAGSSNESEGRREIGSLTRLSSVFAKRGCLFNKREPILVETELAHFLDGEVCLSYRPLSRGVVIVRIIYAGGSGPRTTLLPVVTMILPSP